MFKYALYKSIIFKYIKKINNVILKVIKSLMIKPCYIARDECLVNIINE